MQLTRLKRSSDIALGITGIAPIWKVSLGGAAELIGTGFWVSEKGHLITARHVIEENIGPDGIDVGPIYAMQALADGTAIPRVLIKTDMHKTFDLALSETRGADAIPTWSFPMTLDEPRLGDPVLTYAFVPITKTFDEDDPGFSTHRFEGILRIPELAITYDFSFATSATQGTVSAIFETARDQVMLPFPCFQSTIPIYGANSGGPVFDQYGRVCGINCSSYEGQDISFHVPLRGILTLRARDIEIVPEDPFPRTRFIIELGMAGRLPFDPPFWFASRVILRIQYLLRRLGLLGHSLLLLGPHALD